MKHSFNCNGVVVNIKRYIVTTLFGDTPFLYLKKFLTWCLFIGGVSVTLNTKYFHP